MYYVIVETREKKKRYCSEVMFVQLLSFIFPNWDMYLVKVILNTVTYFCTTLILAFNFILSNIPYSEYIYIYQSLNIYIYTIERLDRLFYT